MIYMNELIEIRFNIKEAAIKIYGGILTAAMLYGYLTICRITISLKHFNYC